VEWVEEVIEQAKDALDNHFQPCFLIVWEYVQRTHTVWWDEQLPFRQWVERYISADALFS